MSRYYEITDGNLHVGWVSEDYMFTKMDERVLQGEAKFDFHVGDRDAVDIAPVRHGHWIYQNYVWYCSECGKNPTVGMGYVQRQSELHLYCPNCGAKMDVSDTDVGKMDETCN
jgi:rubrerythrin